MKADSMYIGVCVFRVSIAQSVTENAPLDLNILPFEGQNINVRAFKPSRRERICNNRSLPAQLMFSALVLADRIGGRQCCKGTAYRALLLEL